MNLSSTSPAVPPLFVGGPTAVGKSDIALRLADDLNGEIVSVDSMQVYRGLDIGTAKPSAAERAKVTHHLIDIVDLAEAFDAAKFCEHARRAVETTAARGKTPIFCGGTGLYFKAFVQGLGDAPPADLSLRAELEGLPIDALLQELKEKDPVAFSNIDQKNPRRVIRAVEVIRLTGKPFSEQRANWHSGSAAGERTNCWFGLSRDPGDLRRRIDVRVDAMFSNGLVEETRRLLAQGLEQNVTALQAIGYRQVVEHLRGERSLEETVELVKIRTRQFAKRQMTWFRRQLHLQWVHLNDSTNPAEAARNIIAKYHARAR